MGAEVRGKETWVEEGGEGEGEGEEKEEDAEQGLGIQRFAAAKF